MSQTSVGFSADVAAEPVRSVGPASGLKRWECSPKLLGFPEFSFLP